VHGAVKSETFEGTEIELNEYIKLENQVERLFTS